MSAVSKIEWTEATWNPTVGCTHVSAGCDHCYAAREASGRLAHLPTYAGLAHAGRFTGEVRLLADRLAEPLKWRKPRRVFVNSMSDLFHDAVPDEFIARVFAVMAMAPLHTFQVLTKRPARMRSMLSSDGFWRLVGSKGRDIAFDRAAGKFPSAGPMALTNGSSARGYWECSRPLPNVWGVVSVEDQHWADIRIPVLLDTPLAVRGVSCEPLLGPVKLEFIHYFDAVCSGCSGLVSPAHEPACGVEPGQHWGIDWVIVGGESGPGARPMHPQWARDLRDQCQAAGVPFFFKQNGEWIEIPPSSATLADSWVTLDGARQEVATQHKGVSPGAVTMRRVGKKAAGRVLDGRTWDECPA